MSKGDKPTSKSPIHVKWIDSTYIGFGWTDDTGKDTGLDCESVGWVLEDTEERLTLVPHAAIETEPPTFGGTLIIPRCAIQEIRTLGPQLVGGQDASHWRDWVCNQIQQQDNLKTAIGIALGQDFHSGVALETAIGGIIEALAAAKAELKVLREK